MTPVRLEPATLRSRVKHSTTEPLRSLERKVVQFYFKSNAILKLYISSMLQVTSAIQSDILHLYLRAVDVSINVSHLPYMQSIPVLANCHG